MYLTQTSSSLLVIIISYAVYIIIYFGDFEWSPILGKLHINTFICS